MMSNAGAVKQAYHFSTRRRLPYLRGYLQLLCRMPLHPSLTELIPQFYDQARRSRRTTIGMTHSRSRAQANPYPASHLPRKLVDNCITYFCCFSRFPRAVSS